MSAITRGLRRLSISRKQEEAKSSDDGDLARPPVHRLRKRLSVTGSIGEETRFLDGTSAREELSITTKFLPEM